MLRIAFVVFPGFQILDLAAIATFELANAEAPRPVYEVQVVSEHGGPVASSCGAAIDSKVFEPEGFDTVIVTGALVPEPSSAGLIGLLQQALACSRRTASICTGALPLAEAGILDGRRATTHWSFAQDLQRRFPRVKVHPDRIFINDGTIWTSAGMTACFDLALALVEEDLDAQVSRAIARKLVVYHRRAGGQSQASVLLELEPKSDRIQKAMSYARGHLHRELSVAELADVANLSPRQFSRAFQSETGLSPARAVERLRVEAARTLIESGQHSLDAVARDTGFTDPERMRRAFHRAFGQPPQAMRRTARLSFAQQSA